MNRVPPTQTLLVGEHNPVGMVDVAASDHRSRLPGAVNGGGLGELAPNTPGPTRASRAHSQCDAIHGVGIVANT
jgi:hypothetical protein